MTATFTSDNIDYIAKGYTENYNIDLKLGMLKVVSTELSSLMLLLSAMVLYPGFVRIVFNQPVSKPDLWNKTPNTFSVLLSVWENIKSII